MKSSLRPTLISDLQALSQFLSRAFGVSPASPFLDPAVMAWKYWEPRADWEGPRSYVLEKDGAIVAHAGIWPMTFNLDHEVVRGIHMIDWASGQESPGAGLALVQKLAGMFDFIFSIGGSEMTSKVLPAFGFVEHTREWKGARPLRPVRQILTHQARNWKLAPRLLRNSMWAMTKASNPPPGWSAIEIQPQALAKDNVFSAPDGALFSERPAAFFEYLLRCPAARFSLYGLVDRDQVERDQAVGHFVIGMVRAQARVAGVWLREPSPDTWAAAYSLARQTAARCKEASEVVLMGSEGSSSEGAAHAGYRILRGPIVYVLDKKGKLRLSRQFQFQLCDSDLGFLDTGKASYWT